MSYGQSDRKFGDGRVEVVDSELPLLLSKEAMKKAEMTVDFVNEKAKILGML